MKKSRESEPAMTTPSKKCSSDVINTAILAILVGLSGFTLKAIWDFNGTISGLKADVAFLKEIVMEKMAKNSH